MLCHRPRVIQTAAATWLEPSERPAQFLGRVSLSPKLWNTNHRPKRVVPAFEASGNRLGIGFVDLYLIHTPYAFRPGDDLDPRDEHGNVVYDEVESYCNFQICPRACLLSLVT